MIQAAAARGYDLAGHLGAQVTNAMLDCADLALAMDSAVLAELRKLDDGTHQPAVPHPVIWAPTDCR